ncbi:MAG TPA: EAL domain-containing protein [Pyrinomonadaceae bacterium]|nr:EAL domain-containing protein [Pyrinomonadaceae bacterium]
MIEYIDKLVTTPAVLRRTFPSQFQFFQFMDNREGKITTIYLITLLPLASISLSLATFFYVYQQLKLASVCAFISLVSICLIFWRHLAYVKYIRSEAATAETAERFRAEQAESNVRQLQQLIEQIEQKTELLKASHEKYEYAAHHDALTDLPNRRAVTEKLNQIFEQKQSSGFILFAIDIDRFKSINDSLGHKMGDKLLLEVSRRLNDAADGEFLARIGGDDFIILLEKISSRDAAVDFARKLITDFSSSINLNESEFTANISIGIALGPAGYSSPDEILRDADIALSYAKLSPLKFVVFDQIMHERALLRLELENDLRKSVIEDRFELYYQPIIELESMRLAGLEALVRWRHPSRGLVNPDEFITVLENTGLIVPVTKKLLEKAFNQLITWEKNLGNNEIWISLNLSAMHITQTGIDDLVEQLLEETGVSSNRIKLEITESSLMQDAKTTRQILERIASLGVSLSIDDFGTGYSNLSYLHSLPIETLKIDRSFVSAMESNRQNGEIVKTIIALGKILGIEIIAEGIETVHQLHQLRILGCNYGQGYIFSPPIKPDAIESYLKDPNRWSSAAHVKSVDLQKFDYTEFATH